MDTRTKTVSITSGKGGVGKTTLLSNLAFALARRGRKVLIFDGDLGMANVDIVFGVRSQGSILDVVRGERSIGEILTPLAPNVSLIPGGSGLVELNRLNSFERKSLLDCLSLLNQQFDYLLIDTAPGISDNVLYLNSAAQIPAVIINPDPSSLTDSYALIKVLNQEYRDQHFAIICNQVRDEVDGQHLFHKFSDVVHRFLNISLDYWGSIPQDPIFRRATQGQRLIMRHDPQSAAAQGIVKIADKLEVNLQHSSQKAGLQFFWEQMIGVAQAS